MVIRRKKMSNTPQTASEWLQIMVSGKSIVDHHDVSEQNIRRRLGIMVVFMVGLFAILILRLLSVTLVSGQSLRAQANGNRIRQTITYAPRGKIYDRNNQILADNNLSFQLTATPYSLDKKKKDLTSEIEVVRSIIGMSHDELAEKLGAAGFDYVLPIVIDPSLTHQQALILESRLPELGGFSVDQIPIREYPNGSLFSQVLGYSGRVSQDDIDNDTTGKLLPTDYIGKTGVELSFDGRLRGENGWTKFEVDALGRPLRVIDQKQPKPGEDIYLSIDQDIQITMTKSVLKQMKLTHTSRSSGVAIDPVNGQVFAMVSLPTYDNNLFASGISNQEFSKLNNDPNQPLFNKALSGGYTTGSIIKPLVASAGLQEGVITEKTIIVDRGLLTLPGGYTFLGWRPEGLGPMNVRSAISWSSNIFFYTVGGGYGKFEGLGVERLTKYYRDFGLGEKSGIDMPHDAVGRVPDEQWKLDNKGEAWYQGDSYNISIGQGDLLVSPLQITLAEATVANNGYLLQPQIERGADRVVRREVSVDKKYLQIVREGMRGVLTGGTTCECTFSEVLVKVAGKSGTAETDTPGGKTPNAWFTAFAPYSVSAKDKPQILATVLLEEGSGGSLYVAPVIADVFSTFFRN